MKKALATVVHVQDKGGYDVYIGRSGKGAPRLVEYPWANPFRITNPSLQGRVAAMVCFMNWWHEPEQAELRERAVRELAGKRLACWCEPWPCHGHVIAEFVNLMTGQTRNPRLI